jgi:hypothetical protein
LCFYEAKLFHPIIKNVFGNQSLKNLNSRAFFDDSKIISLCAQQAARSRNALKIMIMAKWKIVHIFISQQSRR